MIAVHQKAHSAQIKAINRQIAPAFEHLVQGIEHEAVTAQCHHHIGLSQIDEINPARQFACRLAGAVAAGINQCQLLLRLLGCHAAVFPS